MRRLLLVSCFAALAVGQTARPVPKGYIDIKSVRQETIGAVKPFTGAVEIETAEMILHADEADYNASTNEIRPRGNVLLKLR